MSTLIFLLDYLVFSATFYLDPTCRNITSEECKLMVTNEMTLVKKVYDSMKERWDKYLKRSEEHNALDYLRT